MPDDRNMRERIARTIAARWSITPYDNMWASEQRTHLETADAILDELRNPTEAMTRVIYENGSTNAGWQATIDAAKRERG